MLSSDILERYFGNVVEVLQTFILKKSVKYVTELIIFCVIN